MSYPWPPEREILSDIYCDFKTFDAVEASGRPAHIVPGFSKVRVASVPVGDWLTSDDVFSDGGQRIVAASFADSRLVEKITVFRHQDDKQRYEALLAARPPRARRTPDDPEKRIENAIADVLRQSGHEVAQQVKVPGGIADIVDHTAKLIVECKASSKTTMVVQALEQLDRYAPAFPEYGQALGLPDAILNPATLRALRSLSILVLTPSNCDLVVGSA